VNNKKKEERKKEEAPRPFHFIKAHGGLKPFPWLTWNSRADILPQSASDTHREKRHFTTATTEKKTKRTFSHTRLARP
jgi:hypothetical protein